MPIFKYSGYKSDGSPASGTIEAEGVNDAVLQVKTLGIYPKDVHEYIQRDSRFSLRRSDSSLLPHITRQLSILLSTGVPLMEALKSLSEENRGNWQAVLIGIKENVAGGASLSRALEMNPKVFPEFFVNMVSAGEQSGTLEKVLVRLADFLEGQDAIRAKIRIAMIYPAFMTGIGFVILSFIFTFVIPKIVKIFEDTKSALPLITKILICVSRIFMDYWWAILALMAASFFLVMNLRKKHRYRFDMIKLSLPGNVLQSLYFSRFTRTLSFLLEGGLPILKSLELASKSINNAVLEGTVHNAVQKVAEGGRLSASLEGFPPVLLQLISTGEKSGKLPEVLQKAADSYEEDFKRKVQGALSVLEPTMILIMGLIVGFIVLAVLLPMFQLNQLVK